MLETSKQLAPYFDENGLLTAIVTDFDSGELLMVAHMNNEALVRTIQTSQSFFWSRSRKTLWRKGETSGATQRVHEIRVDCDQDAVWLKVSVTRKSDTCHTGASSCFYRRIEIHDDEIVLVNDGKNT